MKGGCGFGAYQPGLVPIYMVSRRHLCFDGNGLDEAHSTNAQSTASCSQLSGGHEEKNVLPPALY